MNTKVHRVVFSASFFCDAEIPNLWPIHSFLIITIRENAKSDTNKVSFFTNEVSVWTCSFCIFSLTQVCNPIFKYNFMWILLIQNMSVDPIFRALNSPSVWIKMTHSESKIGQKINKKKTDFFATEIYTYIFFFYKNI